MWPLSLRQFCHFEGSNCIAASFERSVCPQSGSHLDNRLRSRTFCVTMAENEAPKWKGENVLFVLPSPTGAPLACVHCMPDHGTGSGSWKYA